MDAFRPASSSVIRWIATGVLALALSGCGEEPLPPSGHFSVGSYRLAYHCAGSNQPAIFLETPSGLSAEESFSAVFDEIASTNRVCRFDRLGMGLSDPVPEGLNQTLSDYGKELAQLIELVSPGEPVVLVGYSFGGLVARYYAAHNPARVHGVLLIDAAHEDWLREMKRQMSDDDWQKMQAILDWFLERLGHNYWDSQAEMQGAPSLPADMPVRIISRGLDFQRIRQADISEEGFRIYNDLHDRYQSVQESLTEKTTRVIAKNSEHYIPDTEPGLVIEQLHELLEEIPGSEAGS